MGDPWTPPALNFGNSDNDDHNDNTCNMTTTTTTTTITTTTTTTNQHATNDNINNDLKFITPSQALPRPGPGEVPRGRHEACAR